MARHLIADVDLLDGAMTDTNYPEVVMLSRPLKTLLRMAAPLGVMACASGAGSTGATVGSGVGDKMLRGAPWVAGKSLPAHRGAVVVLPLAWQAGATQPAFMEPGAAASDAPLQQLLTAMQQHLDSLAAGAVVAPLRGDGLTPPDVQFGCPSLNQQECDVLDPGETLGRQGTFHRLAVANPSPAWKAALRQRLDSAQATHAVVITLEIGQYLPRQRGITGSKYVTLGAAHEASLPWLTSLETPVSVIQLTGAVVDGQGKAVRIAAEGLWVKRTPLLLSAIDAQALLRDDDIRTLLRTPRNDLPGQPLVWQAGLASLLRSLELR
ncbi:MAG TPA: hypothetical protein DGD08_09780 [Gemmatimonas aurantiaca]|uniref:Uncharacterized protein n=2 Tax=Gemmatimonas aurantiaca TaxID=173480 RepID=C1A9K2_GEMAT|nr:hypothetical protein [Gemmatimonas aurantiaca]BAH39179.1 hypothetical protein GAU_2137 [Gemmatimonas aurantiaca T-27]HCT57478.1 hypothetical protein [Gemmatimonas aurantiaca]